MPGADGCRGASWSEELDGNELHGVLGGERDQELKGFPFSGHHLHGQPILLHLLQCGMLISKCGPCTAVMQINSTSHGSCHFSRQLYYLRTSGFESN